MPNLKCLLQRLVCARRWTSHTLHPAIGIPEALLGSSTVHLRKLKSRQRHFCRRIRDAYRGVTDALLNTVVKGPRHVYFEEAGCIYRTDLGQGRDEAEAVLAVGARGLLQRVRLSPGERVLAAAVKDTGEGLRCLLVQLGENGAQTHPLPELSHVHSFEWVSDDVLLFTSMDALRCHRVFSLNLRNPQAEQLLLYEEQDPEFFVELSSTRDGRLVTLNCSSKRSSEVWLIHRDTPLAPPTLVQPRLPGLIYHVEHRDQQLYVLANTGPGQEYQLLKTALSSPSMENWGVLFTPPYRTGLIDMELLHDHCVLPLRTPDGPLGLEVIPLANPSHSFSIQLPTWACDIQAKPNLGEDGDTFRFSLSSPVRPPALFCYSTKLSELYIEEDNAQVTDFHTTRLEAVSQDGTLVPLTILHKDPLEHLQGAPLLLHVYGAYGLRLPMTFRPEKRFLVEDGWVLAYCHVRGGGEMGLGWHQAGRLQGKQRGVEDLAACIQHLFDLGVSKPSRAALTARSAGAVLAGSLCNQHPHLLRSVTLQAPFLDVLGTMQNTTLPLTLEEKGEWGDPISDPQHRQSIASYCPCHNIKPQRYPSMLLLAYEQDQRVPLAGVLRYIGKLAAAMQAFTGQPPSLVLDLQPGEDHFGPEDVNLSVNESARQVAFLYKELGLEPDRR